MSPSCKLKTENERLRALVGEYEKTINERDRKIAELQARLLWLTRKYFAAGQSEKHDRSQLLLNLEETTRELEALQGESVEAVPVERHRPRPGSRQSPAEHFKDLPVHETVVIVPEEVKKDPELYEQIGEERTFEVDVIPPQLVKREIVRPRFRHRLDRGRPPVLAPAPARVIEGGYASAGLVSWVVTCKYLDHLPLNRLEQMSASWGARLSRKTMADWVDIAAFWLKPLYDRIRKDLIEGPYLQADETPVNYLDPDNKPGKARRGYLWVIGRPGGPVLFDWRLNRQHTHAGNLLRGFEGLLQADGYQAYDDFDPKEVKVQRLGCMAHIRRKWFESLQAHPREAQLALRIFARIYEREKAYRLEGIGPDARGQRRCRELGELFRRLHQLALICRHRALPKQALGLAASYTLAQWPTIEPLLRHGQVEIDNNLIENAIRPSAVGKKNWLFIGAPDAGARSAIIYSICLTCKRYAIDPRAYIPAVLKALPAMSTKDDIEHLMPWNWKAP